MRKRYKICRVKSLMKRDSELAIMDKKVRGGREFFVFARSKKMVTIQFFGSGDLDELFFIVKGGSVIIKNKVL